MHDRIWKARSSVQRIRGALLTALLAAMGCASAEPPAQQLAQLEEQGRALFLDNCTLCHGENARGDGALPGVFTPAADLTRIASRRGGEYPYGEIASYIDGRVPVDAHRSPEMPAWGRVMGSGVDDPEIREQVARGRVWALVFYLRSIQVE